MIKHPQIVMKLKIIQSFAECKYVFVRLNLYIDRICIYGGETGELYAKLFCSTWLCQSGAVVCTCHVTTSQSESAKPDLAAGFLSQSKDLLVRVICASLMDLNVRAFVCGH